MAWSDKLLETVTKLAPLPSFVFGGGAAVCLFTSDAFLARLGLLGFRDAQRQWIGVTFLVCSFYLVGHSAAWGWKQGAEARAVRKAKRKAIERLHKLTGDESAVLSLFLMLGARTTKFQLGDEAVTALEEAGILYKPQQILFGYGRRGGVHAEVTFSMVEWAWEYLNEHPELVGVALRKDDETPNVEAAEGEAA
jgi:hypothetical protein